MATTEVSIEKNHKKGDNIRVDEREAQLSPQLEEIEIHNKKIVTDKNKLFSALQIKQACLSADVLQKTRNGAVKPS